MEPLVIKTRLDALTGLRYVAASLVLWQHVLISKVTPTSAWVSAGLPVPQLGPLAMSMFFTLSGFLMYYNYHDQFVADFRGTAWRLSCS